jgi:flavin reductase (DIM6/NTAB) family NADH-FMN oxidoreductase RutF
MPVSAEEFRAALSRFASGVTVVTTKDAAGDLHGITVSAFCSVSLEPPLVLICIEKKAGSHDAITQSGKFAVNFLDSTQLSLSERFAAQISDKFEGPEISLNVDGIPILSGCIANLECSVKQAYDGGDHTIFIGEVEDTALHEGDPLLYFRSGYRTIST